MYTLDEGVKGSGMELFLFEGHWMKIRPQNSKGPAKCVCTVYGVLLRPLPAEICARLAGNFCQ